MDIKRFLYLIAWGVGGLVVATAVLSAASGRIAAPNEKKDPSDPAVIVPEKAESRMRARDKILSDRRRMISGLLLVITETKAAQEIPLGGNRFYVAIEILGALRAIEAVRPLLDIIDARVMARAGSLRGPRDPEVIQALANIGKPASTGAVEYLANDKSSRRALMYVRVIYLVEGAEMGKFMVRLAADKEKDPAKKARLEAAISLFDKAGEPVP